MRANIEIQTIHSYASIRLGDGKIEKHNTKGTIDCSDLSIKQYVIPVIITAPDGKTVDTYNIILVRDDKSYISGKILTENVNGEHISELEIYKKIQEEKENANGTKEIVETLELVKKEKTKQDGTFKIVMYIPGEDEPSILEHEYVLKVKKDGYLDYTVEEILLEEEKSSNIGEYKLIAGDVTSNGKINIDDLVRLNNNFSKSSLDGASVNAKICDLNEDGIVDRLDRDILRRNYGRISQIKIFKTIIT